MFKLEFETSGEMFTSGRTAPFGAAWVIANILPDLHAGTTLGDVRDAYGNKIGSWYLTTEDSE